MGLMYLGYIVWWRLRGERGAMISKQRWAVRTGGALALAGSICFAGMGATMAAEPLRLTALQSVKTNILATGQTKCWQGVDPYAEIDCAGTGQDGEYQIGVKPDRKGRFKDNGDGTVEDLLTGLIWLKDASCDELGPDGSVNWQGALEAANALAEGQCGLTDKSKLGDWRLPNVNELLSLIDREFVYPALSNAAGNGQWTEGDAFSGVRPTHYWSSTSEPDRPVSVQIITLSIGDIYGAEKPGLPPVWPVRGGKKGGAAKAKVLATGQTTCWQAVDPYAEIDCAATGQDGEYQMGLKPGKKGRFKDNGNGTVEDLLTGLIWLKDASCDELGPDGSVNWQGALEAANALAEGQCGLTDKSKLGDWRLPNVNELLSLIDREFVYPALSNAAGNGQWTEGDAFSGVQGVYWSSTSYVGNPEGAWAGGIVSGQVGGLSKNLVSEYVWPVRGGKGLSATSRKLD